MALVTGLLFLIYTDLRIMASNKTQEDSTRDIAREIDRMLPENADKIYVMGFRQSLEVTCYLDREVYQLDTFGALKHLREKDAKAYVIYDYDMSLLESNSG